MKRVLDEGTMYPDRTGVGRLTIFHANEVYDLSDNTVPLVTTRKIYMKPFLTELFGMIKGSSKVSDLGDSFWGRWSPSEEFIKEKIEEDLKTLGPDNQPPKEEVEKLMANAGKHPAIGVIGPMYGVLWRDWPLIGNIGDFSWIKSFDDIASDKKAKLSQEFDRVLLLSNGQIKNDEETRKEFIGDQYVKTIDQLNRVFLSLKRNPFSTHHRITAFNPALIGPHADPRENVLNGFGALSPCHPFAQFHVNEKDGVRTLDCCLYMGSSDVCVGRPYNIAFYSLLTILLAHCLDYKPGKFHLTTGNTHIYANHIEEAKKQVKLTPVENKTVVVINPAVKDLFALKKEDLTFSEYNHLEPIFYKANV